MTDFILQLVPMSQLLAFLAAAVALNLTPGSDVMFATASGLAGGPRVGVVAGIGVGLGGLWHVGLAAGGVSAVLTAHPGALTALKWLGALYLGWLAWKNWHAPVASAATAAGARSPRRALWRGFVTNALNPKVALFILAFLPQFTDPGRGPVWQQIMVLGALFSLTGTVTTSGYGMAAGLAGQAMARHMGAMNKVAALVFGALALRLVLRD